MLLPDKSAGKATPDTLGNVSGAERGSPQFGENEGIRMREDYGSGARTATENTGGWVERDHPSPLRVRTDRMQAVTLVRCPCGKHMFDWIGGRWYLAPDAPGPVHPEQCLGVPRSVPLNCRLAFDRNAR